MNIYWRLYNVNWQNDPRIELRPVCLLTPIRFQVKFFYLTQLAYWLHALPELYFQKVRKVSDVTWPAPSCAGARSAAGEATSRVLCFSGGGSSSAAVHLSVSAAHRRSLFTQVSVRHAKREKINAHERAKMENFLSCLPPQHEPPRVGASLPPVRVRTGLPHRQTLLLHRWESSENVSGLFRAFWAPQVGFWLWGVFQVWHVGGQLRVYADGYTDPHVPGSGLWPGSCREPGTGHRGGQL